MFFSMLGGLLRAGLCRSINAKASRRRRQVRCSFSKAALPLETRVLPAATPVGNTIDVAAGVEEGFQLTPGSSQSIAAAANGDFVVAWTRGGQDGGGIMARRFHADGTPAGDEFVVDTTDEGTVSDPSVAMDASGEFVITWVSSIHELNFTREDVFARRFDAEGAALGDDFRLHADVDGQRFAPEVAMHDDGSFMVAWNLFVQDINTSFVVVRRYDAAGIPLEAEHAIANSMFLATPDFVFTSDGGFLLTRVDDMYLQAERYDAGGHAIGSPINVNDVDFNNSPSIAADANGNFVVTWWQYDTFNTHWLAYARRFTADGNAAGPAFLVSSRELAHRDESPSVAMSPEGNFVISWTVRDQYTLSNQRDVFARAFRSDGTPLGDEFRVNPVAEGDQYSGSVAMTSSSEFVINWTDEGGAIYARRYLLNQAPTDVTLSADSIAENQPAGSVVGTFSTADADGDTSFVYQLVEGLGDEDNAAFQIVGHELHTATGFDYETRTSYSIRVRAADLTGASVEKTLTIQVTNVVEPRVVTLTNTSVDENAPIGTVVGTLGLTDSAEGSTRYRLVSGEGATANSRFRISGSQLLTKAKFDFERQSSWSVRVQATDAEGNVAVQVFTVGITDVNEPPHGLTLSSRTVRAGQPAGTTVGQFTGFDVDAGATLTYALISGHGDSGNPQFSVVGNSLVTAAEFTRHANYSIRVRVTDEEGASFDRVFRIRVTRSSEMPGAGPLSAWLSNLWQTSSPWWKQRA